MADYSWLTSAGGSTVDPLNNAYFGTTSNNRGGGRGSGVSMGNANGAGFMNWGGVAGNEAFYTGAMNPGADNETAAFVNPDALNSWLQSNNYTMKDGGTGGKRYRWIQDASGNVVGEPTEYTNKDSAFQAAVLAATAAVTGGVAAAGGTLTAAPGAAATTATEAGGGLLSGMDLAADAALGTGNNIITAGAALDAGIKTLPATLPGASTAPMAPLPATPPIVPPAPLPSVGGALGGAAASSIPSWLPKGLEPAWDFIKDNPKLIGAIGGGLLGGVSGSQEEEAPAPYTGPMPTITRGNWQSSAASGYKPMTQQSYGGGLLSTGGTPQAASGMHRYMGLLGR